MQNSAPDCWTSNKLVNVCALIKDGTHGTHPRQKTGIPLLSAKNITETGEVFWDDTDSRISEEEYCSIHATYEIKPDDLLLTIVGSLGRRALVKQGPKFTVQRSVAIIRPNPTLVYPHYLYHFSGTDYFQRQLVILSNATAQAGVYLRALEAIGIVYPPLPEQRRIAAILDAADEAIRASERVLAKLRQVKAGLLHDLLTCGVDAQGRLRDPVAHPELFKASPLGQIPREWEVYFLGDIAIVGNGLTLGRKISGNGAIELPYLRVANVQDGYLNLSEIKTVYVWGDEVERYQLKPGDMLMTEGGDFDKLGRGVVWEGQIELCLHQNHIFRVRVNQEVLLPKFLEAVARSSYGRHYFVSSSKQTTNLATINSTQLKAFPVFCPKLPEQKRIVAAIDAYDARIRAEEATLAKLRQVKRGLMEDLLTGRVRV